QGRASAGASGASGRHRSQERAMSGRITLPLEGRTAMTLRIRPGLRDAKLHAETMGDHLLTVDGNGDRPKVRAAGAEVEVIHPRFSPRRPDGSEIITLNDAV